MLDISVKNGILLRLSLYLRIIANKKRATRLTDNALVVAQ